MSDPNLGRKIKGFEFPDGLEGLKWDSTYKKYVGKEGYVFEISKRYMQIKFDDNIVVCYPVSMMWEHLILENKMPLCELNPDRPCDGGDHCNTVCWQRSGNKDILSKSHAVAARSGVISMLTEMTPEQIRNEILEPVHPGLGNRIWASEIYHTFMIFRRTVPVSYDWNKEEGRSVL